MRALTKQERGAALKKARLAAGVSQRKLARLARLEVRTVGDLEHVRQGLGLKRARRIARALGCKVFDLLFSDQPEAEAPLAS